MIVWVYILTVGPVVTALAVYFKARQMVLQAERRNRSTGI